jgi:hypothetical protein
LVRFYTIKKSPHGGEKKTFLISELQYNKIWESKAKWESLFSFLNKRETMHVIEIYSKNKHIEKDKESITKKMIKLGKKIEENIKYFDSGNFNSSYSSENRDRRSLVINQNMMNINAMDQLNNIMMEMNIPMEKALDIIIYLCKKYLFYLSLTVNFQA